MRYWARTLGWALCTIRKKAWTFIFLSFLSFFSVWLSRRFPGESRYGSPWCPNHRGYDSPWYYCKLSCQGLDLKPFGNTHTKTKRENSQNKPILRFYKKNKQHVLCSFWWEIQNWSWCWNLTATAKMPAYAQSAIASQSSCMVIRFDRHQKLTFRTNTLDMYVCSHHTAFLGHFDPSTSNAHNLAMPFS